MVTRVYLWYLFFAPKRARQYIMRFKPWRLYLYALKSVFANNRLARLRKWVYIRDLLKANNRDFVSDWRPIK